MICLGGDLGLGGFQQIGERGDLVRYVLSRYVLRFWLIDETRHHNLIIGIRILNITERGGRGGIYEGVVLAVSVLCRVVL